MAVKLHDVKICYGPYLSCSTVQHRTERLEGLTTLLKADGHSVSYEKIPDRDVVELIVHGIVVFRCQIQDLVFGGDGKLDPKCEEALEYVKNAY